MIKPGFIVEGRMEQLIVQRLCPGASVRLLGTNGKDVTPIALANRAAPLIRLMKNQSPIFIIFDREGRTDCCNDIAIALRRALDDKNIDGAHVRVAIPDRMIENWILACKRTRETLKVDGDLEGTYGKSKISAALKSVGDNYAETTLGVDLFCSIDVVSASEASPSFLSFREAAKPYCNWLNGRPPQTVKRKGHNKKNRRQS